ncbi:hypothetical protein MRY87_09465 [bacterium]|nr:hypothetical protein [bacterium]
MNIGLVVVVFTFVGMLFLAIWAFLQDLLQTREESTSDDITTQIKKTLNAPSAGRCLPFMLNGLAGNITLQPSPHGSEFDRFILSIDLPKRYGGKIRFRQMDALQEWGERRGLSGRVRLNDPYFDEQFLIDAEQSEFADFILKEQHIRLALRRLFTAGFTEAIWEERRFTAVAFRAELKTAVVLGAPFREELYQLMATLKRPVPGLKDKHSALPFWLHPLSLIVMLLLLFTAFFSFETLAFYRPVSWTELASYCLPVILLGSAVWGMTVLRMLSGTYRALFRISVLLIAGTIVFTAGPICLIASLNGRYDSGQSKRIAVKVLEKKRSLFQSRAEEFFITTEELLPGYGLKRFSVSPAEFKRVAIGESRVTASIRPGWLGLPWIEIWELHVSQQKRDG